MEVKTISEIYYDDLKTGIYKVFDLEENLRFNLGVGLVYIIHLDTDVTNKPYSYQLAVKDDNVFFRTNEDINNLRFIPTNIKIESDTNNFIKINVNQIENNIGNYFKELNLEEVNVKNNGKLNLNYSRKKEQVNVDSPFRLNEKSEHLNNQKFNTDIKTDNSSFKNPFRNTLDLDTHLTSRSVSYSPIKILGKSEFDNLNNSNKKNNELYVIKREQDLDFELVNNYCLLNIKYENDSLISSRRVLKDSSITLPNIEKQELVKMEGIYDEYKIFRNWSDHNDLRVSSPYIVLEDSIVKAIYEPFLITYQYVISVDKYGQQQFGSSISIVSEVPPVLKTINHRGIIIEPVAGKHNGFGEGKYRFTYNFKLQNITNKPGQTDVLYIKLPIYNGHNLDVIYAEVDFRIRIVYESNNSGGD